MEGMTLAMDVTVYIPAGTPHLSYWGKNLDEITFELVREEEDICAPPILTTTRKRKRLFLLESSVTPGTSSDYTRSTPRSASYTLTRKEPANVF